MKRLHLERWSGTLLPPRNPRLLRSPITSNSQSARPASQLRQGSGSPLLRSRRCFSVSRSTRQEEELVDSQQYVETPHSKPVEQPIARATQSAKLAALHARLSLPPRLPLQTLARCLVHPTADARPHMNNASLALLGQELLSNYTSEWLVCNYPRLPMPVLFAAMYAYVGDKVLNRVRAEWGVEEAVAPGAEVDPGLVQFQRKQAGNALASDMMHRVKDLENGRARDTGRPNDGWNHRRGMSSRIVYDDEFGDVQSGVNVHDTKLGLDDDPASDLNESEIIQDFAREGNASTKAQTQATSEEASASFVRAVFGALYLHAGQGAAQSFHEAHILSRHLPLHTLFDFTFPTRDLSRLCKREGFEPPVARLISETGRHSRTPVFVVGVYSGQDKLGEDAGSSLAEARVRAAAQALRSWYLYTPPRDQVCLPSRQSELESQGKRWKPQMVDPGEIVT